MLQTIGLKYDALEPLGCFPNEEKWNFWSLDVYRELADFLDKK